MITTRIHVLVENSGQMEADESATVASNGEGGVPLAAVDAANNLQQGDRGSARRPFVVATTRAHGPDSTRDRASASACTSGFGEAMREY